MQSANSYWVHDLSPFLVRFPDNPLGIEGIRYYGLAYLVAFLAAWLMLRIYDQKGKFSINADSRAALMTALIIGVLAGGRVGYMLLYDFGAFARNPLLLFRVDQGGMASHGGFVGVILALLWFAYKYKYSLFKLGDVIATLTPIGLLLGRIANFINGELWGKVSTAPWAVIFPDSPLAYDPSSASYIVEPRHPSQIYQAALEGAVLLGYLQWRFWKTKPPAGQIGGEFLLGYGLLRIVGEIFRAPDAELILGMSRGQFYSLFLVIGGAVIILFTRRKNHLKQNTGI